MGSGSIFEDEVEHIRNAEVFEEDYTPEEIVGRDDIIDQYVQIFKPVYKGRPPKNAFLYGDSGVGKTAVTKFLLRQLREDIERKNEEFPDGEQINFNAVRVNCKNISTGGSTASSYQVAVKLLNKLRPPGKKVSATGYAPQDIYDMLYSEIDDLGGSIIIILDEIDRIGDDDTIIYELTRARDNGDIKNARIGLIGISNDMTFRSQLSSEASDAFGEAPIKFGSYDALQLQEILKARAQKALYDSAYDEDTLARCASLAMKTSSGSARRALDLLQQAAEIAEDSGAETIGHDHLDKAEDTLEYEEMVESIVDLDTPKQFVLEAIARLEEEGLPTQTNDIHAIYEAISETWEGDSLSQRGMFNHLTRIDSQGFVIQEQSNVGARGGRYNTYSLSPAVTVEQVYEAVQRQEREIVEIDCENILRKNGQEITRQIDTYTESKD